MRGRKVDEWNQKQTRTDKELDKKLRKGEVARKWIWDWRKNEGKKKGGRGG